MVTYEKEFKEQSVKMASEIGTPRTAQDLGVSINTLYTYVDKQGESTWRKSTYRQWKQ